MVLIRLALRPWRLSFLGQLLTTLTAAVLLFIMGFLIWMEKGLGPVVQQLQSDQVVTAYLSPRVPEIDEKKIVDSVRLSVGAATRVSIEFVGVKAYLQELEKTYPQLKEDLISLGGDLSSLIPRHISIAGHLPQGVSRAIERLPGIESTESSGDRFNHVVSAFQTLQWVGRILIVGLIIALITLMVHLMRMNVHHLKECLNLLKLLGADSFSLRFPRLAGGILVGVLSGLIAAIAWVGVGGTLTEKIQALSPVMAEMQVPSASIAWILLAVGVGIGFASGVMTTGNTETKADFHA